MPLHEHLSRQHWATRRPSLRYSRASSTVCPVNKIHKQQAISSILPRICPSTAPAGMSRRGRPHCDTPGPPQLVLFACFEFAAIAVIDIMLCKQNHVFETMTCGIGYEYSDLYEQRSRRHCATKRTSRCCSRDSWATDVRILLTVYSCILFQFMFARVYPKKLGNNNRGSSNNTPLCFAFRSKREASDAPLPPNL